MVKVSGLAPVDLPAWQLGSRQVLQGCDYKVVRATTKIDKQPQQVTFLVEGQGHLLFGPMTQFTVDGVFQVQEAGSNIWKNCDDTETAKVVLQPNWFEHLVQEVSVYHNNLRVTSSN